jgi:hypothetical protein
MTDGGGRKEGEGEWWQFKGLVGKEERKEEREKEDRGV